MNAALAEVTAELERQFAAVGRSAAGARRLSEGVSVELARRWPAC